MSISRERLLAPAPEGILKPEVLKTVASRMRRDECYHLVYRRRHVIGDDPEPNSDVLIKVTNTVREKKSQGYAWFRFVNPKDDPFTLNGGQPARHAFPQVGAVPQDEFLDYFVVEQHLEVPSKPPARGRSLPLEDDDRGLGSGSDEDVVESSKESDMEVMRRCLALEEEEIFLDPENWYDYVKTANEKAILESSFNKRYGRLEHLSRDDRNDAARVLVQVYNAIRLFVFEGEALSASTEWIRQVRHLVNDLEAYFIQNDGYTAAYCKVYRSVHRGRRLPEYMQRDTAEAISSAKVMGMTLDSKVRAALGGEPPNPTSSKQKGQQRNERRQRQKGARKELADKYGLDERLKDVPADVRKKLGFH
jgi:hypothetical protein